MAESESSASDRHYSLLDRKSTGGVQAWSGFTAQTHHVLTSIPKWIKDREFEGFHIERAEDVDIFYRGGAIHHHQVKMRTLGPADFKGLVKEFRARNQHAGDAATIRRFVIATRISSENVKSAVAALKRYRKLTFAETDTSTREATKIDLRNQLVKGNFVEENDFEFLLEHVDVWDDWGGLESESEPWGRIAGELGRTPEFDEHPVPTLEAAAKELAHRIEIGKDRHWSRAEVLVVLKHAIDTFRAGPPTASGSAVLLCHQSLMSVNSHPEVCVLPAEYNDARLLRYIVDHTSRIGGTQGWDGLRQEVDAMFDPDGHFQQALAAGRRSPVLYYGFPHIPLAALAGYLFGDQGEVRQIEYDRETHRFAWPPATTTPSMSVSVNKSADAGIAILRVSVSAKVNRELCVTCSDDSAAIEIDFGIDEPFRGVVVSEAQVKAYARTMRETLDRQVAGRRDISEIHVFAAVPVSIAFVMGQVVSATGYPPTWVYNFRHSDSPPYHWALCLQRAREEDGLVLPVKGG